MACLMTIRPTAGPVRRQGETVFQCLWLEICIILVRRLSLKPTPCQMALGYVVYTLHYLYPRMIGSDQLPDRFREVSEIKTLPTTAMTTTYVL